MTRTDRTPRTAIAWLGMALLALTTGCNTLGFSDNSVPPPPEPDPLARETYVIGAADKLKITVWRNADLDAEVPVRPDGKISVPLVDDVQAAGLTPEELKQVLTRELEEFIQNPEVTVVVTTISSKRINMVGGLAREGPIGLVQDMRVLDAIAASGGFTEFADKDSIRVLRRTKSGMVEYRFDYDAFLKGKLPLEANFLLMPGDTIVVPE